MEYHGNPTWEIMDSTFIDLHNNGTESGIVYIWIDNISTTDRYGNPGGGLANYMIFQCLKP